MWCTMSGVVMWALWIIVLEDIFISKRHAGNVVTYQPENDQDLRSCIPLKNLSLRIELGM